MRVSFLGHASVLLEAKGIRVLSDPWWEGPCFGTQWWVYPRADTSSIDGVQLDYVYISHGHHDHLHLGTLRRLPKIGRVLVSSTLDIGDYLEGRGFDVWRVRPNEEVELGNGLHARLVPTCNGDTFIAIDDGREVYLNLNDAVHAAPSRVQDRVLAELKQWYPNPTYLFCGYGIASHFPACYILPGADRIVTVAKRQAYFNRKWVEIVAALSPRFAFPFAADVAILDDNLIWANAPVHNTERPTDVFQALHPSARTQSLDIAPGFTMEGNTIHCDRRFKPLNIDALKRDYAREYEIANRKSKLPPGGLAAITNLLREKVIVCLPYLREFDGNYKILIALQNCDGAIIIEKKEQDIIIELVSSARYDVDLIFSTRFSYLRRALTEKYGAEVLYVGSGCIIEYRNTAMIAKRLHADVLTLLRHRLAPPPSRFGDQPRWLYVLKTFIKGFLGREEVDLYDLGTWIIRSDRSLSETSDSR